MEKFLYKRLDNKEPKINLWFSFPAIESFALASLGYLTIFKDFDLDPNIFVERVYSDTKTTLINPSDVHCMGFSVSFELDILTIIKMLKKYDFPLLSSERKDNDPLIFAGGPVLMSNPKPYEEFFDFISIGEKVCLSEAFRVIKSMVNEPRDLILKRLSEIEGIYVPKYPSDSVKIIRDEIKNNIVTTPILSDKSYFSDTFIIELERGCPKMCKFCLASWLNIPTRFVDYDEIIKAIDFGLAHTNKIALLGAYVAGHPDFKRIIEHISSYNNIELSISSLRADLADIELIKTLVKCNQKTATIALEAGSQRLRDYIKKDLTTQQVINTLKAARDGGLKGMKIYLMLGLPTENDEDIEELIDLARRIKSEVKGFDITLSASSFIPKPHTPFEDAPRCDKKVLEKRINYLKKTFHKLGINFRTPSVEWDIVQTILSRYPKSLASFLIDVVEKGGNLGAFKQTWRQYNKQNLLPTFEDAQNLVDKNVWSFIKTH